MSAALLFLRRDLNLLMVDNWRGNDLAPEGYRVKDQKENNLIAKASTHFARNRRGILRGDSIDQAQNVEDESLDFVFIDADHSFPAVTTDINAWTPKVKRGGIIGGHDYDNKDSEVKEAVDKAAKERGWQVEFGCQTCWYVRK